MPLLLLLGALLIAAPALASDAALYRLELGGHELSPRELWQLRTLRLDIAGHSPGRFLDFIGDEEHRADVEALGYRVTVQEPSMAALQRRLSRGGRFGPWRTLDEANQLMQQLAASNPQICAVQQIGTSIENRPISAVKISDNVDQNEDEPEALFMGCHHARELISVEIPLSLMETLVNGYGVDAELTRLVNEREMWFVPILNPDGYHYALTTDLWWRKNRRPNATGSFGVDPNRNYAYQWGLDDLGSSPFSFDQDYRGTGPFSEPETQALRDLVLANDFAISSSYHSYGDLLLYPWGYQYSNTPDHAIFSTLGQKLVSKNGYFAGNTATGAIYQTNGDSDDWLYGEQAAKDKIYSFTWEVGSSFAPPDWQIPILLNETIEPALWMAEMAGAAPFVDSFLVTDFGGNNNGNPEQGETLALDLTLRNYGLEEMNAVSVSLLSLDGNAAIVPGSVPLGALDTIEVAQFLGLEFIPNPQLPRGSTIDLALEITWQGSSKILPLESITLRGDPVLATPTPLAPTLTPTPLLTPTPTVSPDPTPTPTGPPSPTATPSPLPQGFSWLAGYGLTSVSSETGGALELLLSLQGPVAGGLPNSVELLFLGMPTGVELRDDGLGRDVVAGDGLYAAETSFLPRTASSGEFLFGWGIVGQEIEVLGPRLVVGK